MVRIRSGGRLTGKVALVTGAGSGIGLAVTKRFVEEGASVVAFDLSRSRLDELRHEAGESVFPFCGDARTGEDNRAAVDAAVSRFGALHVFVANAGTWDGKRRLADLSAEELGRRLDEVFALNVKGYFLGAQAAIPALERTGGSLIMTLSTSSFYVGGGSSIYVAAKHATLGLMRALAHELAPVVRVNGVAPSGTPTSGSPLAGGPKSNLLGRSVRAEDHTGAYVLLASDDAPLMTGTVIHSDGGRGVMAERAAHPQENRRE